MTDLVADQRQASLGYLYTLGAFGIWGASPIFWKALGHVPAGQLLACRILFCALIMAGLLLHRRRLTTLKAILAPARVRWTLVLTTLLIGSNWFLYVWAVNHQRILEVSLGYFINPLISVLLGLFVLKESLRFWQVISIAMASLGVIYLVARTGSLPWLALCLALSFGFYALLRKTVAVPPEEGLAIETWLLSPLMLLYLGYLYSQQTAALGTVDRATDGLLVASGLLTATPLIWFTHGAKRLPLSTVGLMQYLAPTCQFLLAVGLYDEPFTRERGIAFLLIWTALIIFTIDARVSWRKAEARRRRSP